ncbi:uncharacterized protein LOC130601023 [Pezoporus wallicus]|uniref:uncharacterized protein LOC130601023 n=1 Tax=Pezoporus wallicus TaxID=35540 RepID=UPI00254F4068|nr:uncharacterized protein LOC130601023 [Pezoporus wallicus]
MHIGGATSHVQELALPSGSSSAYHNACKCYVETVEALKQIGQMRHLYAALKEQVAQIEATRLEQTEMEKLHLLLQEGVCSIEGDSGRAANVLLALRAYGHWPSKPGLSPWGSLPTWPGTTLLFSSLEQDQEVLKRIQAAILQMQGEYEKLNSVTGRLLDDSRQQQKDIEGLLRSMEKLEKEKADKDDLELGMDEKADKGALESKVSRTQFEASLELLNKRNQEVLSWVTGQVQGLHEVQQQLREEMASKVRGGSSPLRKNGTFGAWWPKAASS